MESPTLIKSLLLCLCLSSVGTTVLTQPEQVHLSLTGVASEMMVTWVTQNATGTPMVEFGTDSLSSFTKGYTDVFEDGGSEHRILFIHRVVLTGLRPAQQYIYHVGSPLGWSEIFTFRTVPEGTDWSVRLALYGDMGNKNAQSLGLLQEETQRGHFDAIFHVGDFAYNMDTDNARVGDAFMNQIQSIAAYVPYMTCVGNHENKYNFSNYRNRFSMPGGDGQGMFYSFNIGSAHVVAFSSEYYYYVDYGFEQIVNQYKWLEKDLQEANTAENRALRPWIITMTHRPMYCSNSDDAEHCTNDENMIRVGLPYYHMYGPEQLLFKYGVDLNIQAHEHSYERLWPVYNRTVCNGSTDYPYVNPKATVHIVTGSSGCQEGVDPFVKTPQPWSAFHSDDYGYTRITILNTTHLHLEQITRVEQSLIRCHSSRTTMVQAHLTAASIHSTGKNPA